MRCPRIIVRMRRLAWLATWALALPLAAGSLGCGPKLALRRVVLYQNGIGYFERDGRLQGERYRLQLRDHEVGDVLKSLLVVERGATGQRAVSAVVPQPEELQGDAKPSSGRTWLDILLQGGGRHDVMVAYAVPTPAWKPAYRVVLPGTGADGLTSDGLLQAWAIVDNVSGEPWNRVELVLATGAPLSFAMDLRTPRFIPRPDLSGQLVQPVATAAVVAERAQASPGDPDTDRDGIPDRLDKCPSEPETYNGFDDEDGCPDRGRVVISSSKIEVLDKVYFERGSSEVRAPSVPIVDAVGATLAGNPEITRIEISGHACPSEPNPPELSERRAAAVRYQLTKRGIASSRLTSRGYGSDRPVADGKTEEGCSRSRRVEFQIVQRLDDSRAPRPAAPASTGDCAQRALQSARPLAKAENLAGNTRYVVSDPVSLPRGSSTMISLLTLRGGTEDIYLFRPEAGVQGSDRHPLRAARIQVGTALEPGPVAVFAAGSFVGEGVLTRMHPGETALLPYAIDSSASVQSASEESARPQRLISLHRGEAVVEDLHVLTTTYQVTAGSAPPPRLFVRHPRRSGYTAQQLPAETETSPDALLVPCGLAAEKTTALSVVEQRQGRRTIALKSSSEPLGPYLAGTRLPGRTQQQLAELWQLQQAALTAGGEVDGLRRELDEVRTRAEELRDNLRAVEKIATAASLRTELLRKLTENEKKSDELQKGLIARTETQAAASARLNQLLSELQIDAAPETK